MTDRELLELAAKAAGHNYYMDSFGVHQIDSGRWNPLYDDGDALRLAVKLGVDIYIDDGKLEVWVTEFNHPI